MAISLVSISLVSTPKKNNIKLHRPNSRSRKRYNLITCCSRKTSEKVKRENKKNYYELLGVHVESNSQEIKEAYRKLQKIYHPDIAGPKGHEHSLRLNEAYKVLLKDELRAKYDASIGQFRVAGVGKYTSGLEHSTWKGPLRPQALFVDENSCIGCRECVHHASSTFTMDEALGRARVKVQYGDDDKNIEVAVDSCPVNCIHWVEREDLTVLEFLTHPQQKEEFGVFGGSWEKPANVFMAAKSLSKELKQKAEYHHKYNGEAIYDEETPAQAEARANAVKELQMDRFTKMWSWVKEIYGFK